MPLEDLGRLILARRNTLGLGIRGAAKEVGISHATLARVEKGFLPDLENYEKIRKWLRIQDETVVARKVAGSVPLVNFRREKTATPATAASLARMILAAQAAWPKGKN
jgi:transcriptional regulator with XRE-family HTH domain